MKYFYALVHKDPGSAFGTGSHPTTRLCLEALELLAAMTPEGLAGLRVADLGCGTGRYFWGLRNVRTLVGLDASEAMLTEARRPLREDRVNAATLTLVRGDLEGLLHRGW